MNQAMMAVFLLPCTGGVIAFVIGRRPQVLLGLLTATATTGALGLLARQVLDNGAQAYWVGGWAAPLGINLRCDGLSLLMLMLTAVVCLSTSLYAALYFGAGRNAHPEANLFWPLWLFLWGGLNCLFLSGDIFNSYLLLEFTLLSSVALVSLGGSHTALIAAFRYLIAATTAALFYLLGVTLLYSEFSTLDLLGLKAASPAGFLPLLALGLLIGGLSLKSALFPLHFWLPPAHATAPAPVSAVLSGLVVKAGFYVLLRIWFEVFPQAVPEVGKNLLATLGAIAIVWGSWKALQQARLKMLIAYSTVAQMGYLFLVFALAAGTGIQPVSAAVYQMISHGLSKAAMFLAAGVIVKSVHSDRLEDTRGCFRKMPAAVAAITVSGANLAGIAPAGGAKGKLLGIAVENSQWGWAAVVGLGMLLAVAYTAAAVKNSFLASERKMDVQGRYGRRALELIALAMALLALTVSFFSDEILTLLEIKVVDS
jgi:multicomponent Na+:H+ antiporter subunit D